MAKRKQLTLAEIGRRIEKALDAPNTSISVRGRYLMLIYRLGNRMPLIARSSFTKADALAYLQRLERCKP